MYLILYIIGFVFMNVCFTLAFHKISERYKNFKSYTEICAYCLSFLVVILIIQHNEAREYLTKHWVNGKNGLKDLVMVFLCPLLIYIGRIMFLSQNKKIVRVCFCIKDKVEIIYKIIVAPISEEILFRNLLLAALLENNRFMFAGFVVSLVFAISHLRYETFIYFFVSSFVFSYLFWISGSILYTIGSHMIYNLLCCIISVQVDTDITNITIG